MGHSQARSIAAHHGVPSISPNLHAYMSRALEAHMGDLLRRAYVIARQRADVGRRMPAMEVASCHILYHTAGVEVRCLCIQGARVLCRQTGFISGY